MKEESTIKYRRNSTLFQNPFKVMKWSPKKHLNSQYFSEYLREPDSTTYLSTADTKKIL